MLELANWSLSTPQFANPGDIDSTDSFGRLFYCPNQSIEHLLNRHEAQALRCLSHHGQLLGDPKEWQKRVRPIMARTENIPRPHKRGGNAAGANHFLTDV